LRSILEDSVADLRRKSFTQPDETLQMPGIDEAVVEIGGFTVAKVLQEPGWVWSRDMRPLIGAGEYCEARHVGLVVSGRWGATLRDGTTMEFGPDDVFDVPPGHDGYTIGPEPCVIYEFSGVRSFIRPRAVFADRVLATVMFTDLVASTEKAVELGDRAWRDLLSEHLVVTRGLLERFHGREVEITGDEVLALFDGPGLAIRCAAAICKAARDAGLRVRAGVHVGEVELAGAAIRGVTVHEASRIMSVGAADQVIVSEIARSLAEGTGLTFDDLGAHALKGLEQPRHLFVLHC
jgi:class 3 adenylate cyclase